MSESLAQSRLGWLLALLSALNVCVTLESAQHVAPDSDRPAKDSAPGSIEREQGCAVDEHPVSNAPDKDEEPESAPPRRVVLQPEVQGGGGRLLKGGGPPRCPLKFSSQEELWAEGLRACRCEPRRTGQLETRSASLAVVARQIQSHAPPRPA